MYIHTYTGAISGASFSSGTRSYPISPGCSIVLLSIFFAEKKSYIHAGFLFLPKKKSGFFICSMIKEPIYKHFKTTFFTISPSYLGKSKRCNIFATLK